MFDFFLSFAVCCCHFTSRRGPACRRVMYTGHQLCVLLRAKNESLHEGVLPGGWSGYTDVRLVCIWSVHSPKTSLSIEIEVFLEKTDCIHNVPECTLTYWHTCLHWWSTLIYIGMNYMNMQDIATRCAEKLVCLEFIRVSTVYVLDPPKEDLLWQIRDETRLKAELRYALKKSGLFHT